MASEEFTKRALRGLNPHYEPQWARVVGLVRGDDAAIADGAGGVRYACCACELMVEASYAEIAAELAATPPAPGTVDDPITAKGWVPRGELVVRRRFAALAQTKGCRHLAKRLQMAAGPAHKVFDLLALANLAKGQP